MTAPATDITSTDAAELARAIGAGELTSVEVTRAYLDRIAAEGAVLGAYLHVDPAAALRAAEESDAARAAGASPRGSWIRWWSGRPR